MAKEALEKVLTAEKQAYELMKKAKKECDDEIQSAKLKAENLIIKQRKTAKINHDKEIDNYISKSNADLKQFQQEIIDKYAKIEKELQNNLSKASDAILSELLNNIDFKKD